MDSKGEAIEIEPKTRILSPAELTKQRHVEVEPLSMGLKRTHLTGDSKERQELEKLHAALRKQISVPRIDRLAGRSLAVWDEQAGAVRVTRKDGKFGNFGYSRDGQLYLEFFEALFLLELGRLQLEYHDQIVSIEQGYLLLLGEEASSKYNEYLVYSNFMRVGYILVKHKNSTADRIHFSGWVTKSDCVWEVLFNALHQKIIPFNIVNSPYYKEVKQSMESVKRRIRDQDDKYKELPIVDQPYIDFERKIQTLGKRKSGFPKHSYSKRRRGSTERPRSYLDVLKNDPEYQRFQELFEKFDVIELNSETEFDGNSRDLKITFDLFLHNDGFRRSAPGREPKFRLVLLERDETFPTHAEISKCYNGQQIKVPLLVVSISESKQIQAFIYFFT